MSSLAIPADLVRLLSPNDPARIVSRADSAALFKRVLGFTTGGGDTTVTVRSAWTTSLRWARNRPIMSSNTIERLVVITRQRNGVSADTELEKLDDASLQLAVQTLEQQLASSNAAGGAPLDMLPAQQYAAPTIWSEATYALTARDTSQAARSGVIPVAAAKLVAAGNLSLCAATWAIFNTRGLEAYAAATGAMYTETVRAPDGDGSGWAGRTHMEWTKLDVPTLAARALQKCRDSARPVAIEPGRYTAILEPDAVAPLLYQTVGNMDRQEADQSTMSPFYKMLGRPILDRRITISTDPMDPDGGYMPFDPEGYPYRPVTWVEQGILKNLPYSRRYGRAALGQEGALPNPLAFRVSGGETSIDEMIATTQRGILVTDFGEIDVDDPRSLSLVGVTRNGLWLIENGKIKHPIKNMWIYESPLVVFNKILALGQPVRVKGRKWVGWSSDRPANLSLPSCATNDGFTPIVVPPIKVEDFNFTRLSDAV